MTSTSELRYRTSAAQEAPPAGLVVILYDILVGDLRQGIAAMRAGDIEPRCNHLKHGLSALQVLEGSLDLEKGGDASQCLSRFYSHLRAQILRAQFQNDARILEEQIALIFSLRDAWQEVNTGPSAQPGDVQASRTGLKAASGALDSFVSCNWSA